MAFSQSSGPMEVGSVRLLVLWSRPADEAAFETDYLSTHMPLAAHLPGIKACMSSRIRSKQFHRCAELLFACRKDLSQAMASDVGHSLAADAERLAQRYGVESTSLIVAAADINVEPIDDGGPSNAA